jgi:putative hydrolase of the HAD superfamily
MIKGVLFDLFHTLTDIESNWSDLPWTSDVLGIDRAEWNTALTQRSRWRLAGEVNDPREIVSALARALRPGISDDQIDQAVAIRIKRFQHTFERIPAANVALIDELRRRGVRTALVSNADAMEVAAYEASPLAGRFDCEVFSCQVGLVKPEPEIYRHALRQLGLDAAECAFVGDGGSNELVGAKAVGLQTVFVSICVEDLWPGQVDHRASVADHRIRHASELLQLPLWGPSKWPSIPIA